jgi:hypothetical protein
LLQHIGLGISLLVVAFEVGPDEIHFVFIRLELALEIIVLLLEVGHLVIDARLFPHRAANAAVGAAAEDDDVVLLRVRVGDVHLLVGALVDGLLQLHAPYFLQITQPISACRRNARRDGKKKKDGLLFSPDGIIVFSQRVDRFRDEI